MKHYYGFTPSGKSFADHDYETNEFFTALGMVAVAFSELEDRLSDVVISLLSSQAEVGRIVVAELSFKTKVNLFASLVRHMKDKRSFAIPKHLSFDEVLNDLLANIFKAEELRNTVMHSSWSDPNSPDEKVMRSKSTAKSKHGFRITQEVVNPGYLVDIAEFTQSVAVDVFGIVFGKI